MILAALLEPRGPSAVPVIHMLATLGAIAWASRAARLRPVTRGTWRLGVAATAAALVGDALLVVSAWSTGLAIVALTGAFVLGCALLLISLLQGWPSRPMLFVAGLALVAPFVLWL